MKRFLALFLLTAPLGAQVNLNSSMSTSAIQSALTGATSGEAVNWAAGTYSITTSLNIPCSNLQMSGPVASTPTAILSASFTNNPIFIYPASCANLGSVKYLAFTGTGATYFGGSSSNFTFEFNTVSALPSGLSNTTSEAGLYLDGNTSQTFSNFTIENNTFGDSSSCTTVFGELTDQGGYCIGVYVGALSATNITIENNNFVHLEEGLHFVQLFTFNSGTPESYCTGCVIEGNYVHNWHRIGMEIQNGTVGSSTLVEHNVLLDPLGSFYGTFAYSLPCCQFGTLFGTAGFSPGFNFDDNLAISTQPIGNQNPPYGVEFWGNGSLGTNSLIQGNFSNGYTWGYGSGSWAINNNYICGPYYVSQGGYISNEEGQSNPPSQTGNVTNTSCSSTNSTAPTISITGPSNTVTLADSGENTSIWYTVNGSTPVPGSATLYTAPFNIGGGVTVKAVGMWGNSNQPTSYPSGYGYVPSSVVSQTSSGGVAITLPSKYPGWTVLAGSVRHINATITGGTGNLVNWSISGTTGGASATLSASTNAYPWVDITIGSTAGNCSVTGSIGSYGISSTATVTLQAQSVDDATKTATIVFDVCANTTQVITVPFYRALYQGQKEDIQSWVLGNTNENVTWAITAAPAGGNSTLSDTGNRDTVFTAGTVTGRYTVTATSAADGTKTAVTTIYVTPHALPSYSQTPNQTEPVDCTADPAQSGATYDVGPSQTYTTISAAMTAINNISATDWHGNTVRIHNEDLTGHSPTTYHEYFQIHGGGQATQPIRVCGVPDSSGNLPVVDAANSTAASWVSTGACAGFSAVCVWPGPPSPFGMYFTGPVPNAYVLIEGLSVRNANSGNTYTPPGGGSPVAWGDAECIGQRSGSDFAYVGNEFSGCSNGTFTDFNDAHSWAGFVGHSLFEGNYIHGDGTSGNQSDHQLYVQGWLQLMQFNIVDLMLSGAQGSNYKDRGVGSIVRYNYFGDGASGSGPLRTIDAVDQQDAASYMTLDVLGGGSGTSYMGFSGNTSCSTSWYCQGDALGVNGVTGWNEMWHQYYLYGNVMQNSSANFLDHFMSDHGAGDNSRQGYLYNYNNTINVSTSNAYGIIDTDDNNGGTAIEYPVVQMQNNIVWSSGTSGYQQPCWNRTPNLNANWVTNVVASGLLTNITTPLAGNACNANTGWEELGGATTNFTFFSPINNHFTGLTAPNFIATSSQPFTTGTYAPVSPQSGTSLGTGMSNMPVRFQFTLNGAAYYTSRSTAVTSSTGGIVGAVDTSSNLAPTPTFVPMGGTYASTQNVTITSSAASNSTNVQNSLSGWDTCILPGCNPGGTGTPVSTSQTTGNATPSLSGSSMLVSLTANVNDTNALWTFYGADCDACTNFNVDYWAYPPTTAGLGALEYDQFQFSVPLNTEFMWGMQYCMIGSGCPGGRNSWDIWDQLHGTWIDTGITTAPTLGAWNHIQVHNHRVVGDTNSCSGQPCMHYDTFILNGTLHALNTTEPAGTLPVGFSSGDGFQVQMDVATVSGTQTYAEYLDEASFSETPSTFYYTTDGSTPTTGSTVYVNPLTISTTTTVNAIATQAGDTQSSVGTATYTIGVTPSYTWAFTASNGTVLGTNSTPGTYISGTTIGPLTPSPNLGYSFSSWSGATGSATCSGATNPCPAFSLGANSSITANFSINSYTLSTSTGGTGSGTVTGCAGSLHYGVGYSCTVTPAAGSTIFSVSGCGGTGSSTFSGSMPANNCVVTATFTSGVSPTNLQGVVVQGVTVQK